ncbi:hypothetical protein FHS67_002820 [Aminobacter aminovorans]|uniref:Uncharacterized protein n=1 Tax=Aminobacter aminovorans TaxID=83263 RepID=A0AAC8YLF8_AMIAI|nr:hypothetical protein AA2016_1635 [Aminobacter aminovorans]MBB3706498.1 hypothetical protein [Aminobacter aminovorans]
MTILGTAVQQLSQWCAMVLPAPEKDYPFYDVDVFAHLCNLASESTNEH